MAEETKIRKRRRWPWIVAGVLLALVVAFVMLTPTIIVSLDYAPVTFDLAPNLEELPDGLVSNKTVTVKYDVSRDTEGRYVIHAIGQLLDWPFTAWVNVKPSFGLFGVDMVGDASFRLDDTKLHFLADFTASSSGDWRADINMAKTEICESDALVSQILSRLDMPAISNLVFNGTFEMSARAERTSAVPVPKWTAVCSLANVSASCEAGGGPVSVENLRVRAGAFGIANHLDINPLHPHADSVTAAGFTLSNVFASVYNSGMSVLVTNGVSHTHRTAEREGLEWMTKTNIVQRSFVVTEAGASLCGGDVRLYSFVNNDRELKATLSIDGVDAGEALRHMKGFSGEASGALYGKLPLSYRKRERCIVPEMMHLHSVPGEKGKLKLFNPKPVVDNLALGGVDKDTCDNLATALTDLSYDVLKISLTPEEDGKEALTLKIAGKSEHEKVTIPVTLEVTFHGDLDTLLNTGLQTFKKRK